MFGLEFCFEFLVTLLCLDRVSMFAFMYGLNFGDEVLFKEGRL